MLPVKIIKQMMLATLFVLMAGDGLAKKLYKYQDEDGKWHFTDKQHVVDKEADGFEEMTIRDSAERKIFSDVWVREEGTSLVLVNNYFGPVEAFLKIDKCKYCYPDPGSEVNLVVPANSERRVVEVIPESARARWSVRYQLEVQLGAPDAVHDDGYQYGLPYPEGHSYLLTQGFNGPFSHKEGTNQYALDFAMPIGTPVHAVRDGVVMAVLDDFTENGIDPKFSDKANVVYLLHSDGSMSLYAHLDMHSVLVEPGQEVKRGEVLARSGNTGFSTGPHLHFSILTNARGKMDSVPFQFAAGGGKSFSPQAGFELSWNADAGKVVQKRAGAEAHYVEDTGDKYKTLEAQQKEERENFVATVSQVLSLLMEGEFMAALALFFTLLAK